MAVYGVAFEEMQNKILQRRAILIEAIGTLDYQLEHLQNFYSKQQVRCWKKYRAALRKQLKKLPTEEELRASRARTREIFQSLYLPKQRV